MLGGINSAFYIATLLNELHNGKPEQTMPLDCIEDNKSLCDASNKLAPDKNCELIQKD